jgi:ANTAR domain
VSDMTVQQAFSTAVSALVDEHDVGDVLAELVNNCAELYPASAVSILVARPRGGLELLSSTSHRASDLELLQVQRHAGPCVEAITTGEKVAATGRDAMVTRWGDVGKAITEAGFETVEAYPLRWRERRLGGLNIFVSGDLRRHDQSDLVGQIFADVATLALVMATDVPPDLISARVHEAVSSRTVVEQAKGVLAFQHSVGMAEAYAMLVRRSEEWALPLSETAHRVIKSAYGG